MFTVLDAELGNIHMKSIRQQTDYDISSFHQFLGGLPIGDIVIDCGSLLVTVDNFIRSLKHQRGCGHMKTGLVKQVLNQWPGNKTGP